MKVTWHEVSKETPQSYDEYWIWWPGLSKPVIGEWVYDNSTSSIFVEPNYGRREEVTHWAVFEKPDVPTIQDEPVSMARWAGFDDDGRLLCVQDYHSRPFRACIYSTKEDALEEHEEDNVHEVTITWSEIANEHKETHTGIRR